jgi:hypothetical protein
MGGSSASWPPFSSTHQRCIQCRVSGSLHSSSAAYVESVTTCGAAILQGAEDKYVRVEREKKTNPSGVTHGRPRLAQLPPIIGHDTAFRKERISSPFRLRPEYFLSCQNTQGRNRISEQFVARRPRQQGRQEITQRRNGCAGRAPDTHRDPRRAAAAGVGQEQARENHPRCPEQVRVPFDPSHPRGVLHGGVVAVPDFFLVPGLSLLRRRAVVDSCIVRFRSLLRRDRRGQVTAVRRPVSRSLRSLHR